MTDEQPPIAPPAPDSTPVPTPGPPPPPDHGPFAFPPPPDQTSGWGPPPDQPNQLGWPTPRGFYPLTLGRVFELTFSLYRFRWRTFVAIAIAIMVPVSALVALADYYQFNSPDWISEMSDISSGAQVNYWATLAANLPLSIAYGIIVGIISIIGNGAIADATARVFGGSRTSALQVLRHALGRLVTWIGIAVLIYLVNIVLIAAAIVLGGAIFGPATATGLSPGPGAFLGLIVLVAIGAVVLFLTVRWTFAAQAVVLESAGTLTALRRSWRIVSGSGWRVLGYILAFGLLVGLIAGVLSVAVTLLLNPIQFVGLTVTLDPARLSLATFISGVLGGVLVPIPTIALTLLYYDLRFRHGEQVPQPGGDRRVS